MGSLLSTVTTVYLEPPDGIEIANSGKFTEKYKDAVVKFQSLSLMNPILLEGKKVFLYRPLLSHLYKIKSDSVWHTNRAIHLREMLKKNQSQIDWIPKGKSEFIAYQWIISVLEMRKHKDVLWVQSNDFFKNKKEVMNSVCAHFDVNSNIDFSLANLNVKRIKFPRDKPFDVNKVFSNSEIVSKASGVSDNHGVIENFTCFQDEQIVELTKKIEELFPELKVFLY